MIYGIIKLLLMSSSYQADWPRLHMASSKCRAVGSRQMHHSLRDGDKNKLSKPTATHYSRGVAVNEACNGSEAKAACAIIRHLPYKSMLSCYRYAKYQNSPSSRAHFKWKACVIRQCIRIFIFINIQLLRVVAGMYMASEAFNVSARGCVSKYCEINVLFLKVTNGSCYYLYGECNHYQYYFVWGVVTYMYTWHACIYHAGSK